jgi:hypothetical protein
MAITFKRLLSPFIQSVFDNAAAINSRAFNTELVCEFVLKDGTLLHYGTRTLTMDTVSQNGASVSITPLTFTGRLTGTPEIRHTQGKAPDGGEFSLANLDYIITSVLPTVDRPFDNAYVTCYLCFPKSSGNYEGQIYFKGLLSDVGGDDEVGSVSAVSDLSHKAALIGREITQRCLNELGDAWCGVGHLPGGAVCTKDWADKVAGCGYWGGVFKGAPFINPNGLLQGVFGPGSGGGGTGFGGGGCPDVDTTLFPSANGGIITARDIRVGEYIFDPHNIPVEVQHAEIMREQYRYSLTTNHGANLIVSATHRFLTYAGDNEGQAAVEFNGESSSILLKIKDELRLALRGLPSRRPEFEFWPTSGGEVLFLSVSGSNTYLAGQQPDYWVGSHNKAYDPIYGLFGGGIL